MPFPRRRSSAIGPQQNGKNLSEEQVAITSVSEFRTLLPQVLASTAKNLILLDLGMTLAFPTLVIATLLKAQHGLQFSEEQASWFSSILYICQPAGSMVSGLLFEPMGRKRAMLLVNIPHISAWLLLHFATSTVELYIAGVIMGLGVGFMEAPIITYVGEISQPKWRGVLTSYAGIFVTLGHVFVYFLGIIMDWQLAAGICAAVPVLSILVISQVPESPIWLLSKGRLEEAERALCWLRGWVAPSVVRAEYNELMQHNYRPQNDNVTKETLTLGEIAPTTNTLMREAEPATCFRKVLAVCRVDDLCRRQTLQPLIMVIVFFVFYNTAGITSTRPYLVRIFEELGSPLDPHVVTMISSVVAIVGNIICMVTVGRLGKKALSLYTMGACAVFNLALCATGFSMTSSTATAWIPVTLYILLIFAWSCGVGQVPWMLTSEVFPFRGRGVASGVAAAASYVLGFVVTKSYNNLYNWLTLPGLSGFYGLFCVLGCLYFYFFLPETEGKSLEEIEDILEKKFNALRKGIFMPVIAKDDKGIIQ